MQYKNTLGSNVHVYGSRIVAPYEVFEVDGAHVKDQLFEYLLEKQFIIPFQNYAGATTVAPVPPIVTAVPKPPEQPKAYNPYDDDEMLRYMEQPPLTEADVLNALQAQSTVVPDAEAPVESPAESTTNNTSTEMGSETLKPKTESPSNTKKSSAAKKASSPSSPKSTKSE